MATKQDGPSSSNEDLRIVRLLLHTADGAIPYLTPHLLEACFPVDQVKDHLWLGLAVRDTCISPITAKDDDKKKAKHPCGYTFASNISPDPWLLSYTRVTVPTFDPHQDATRFSPKRRADKTTLTSGNQHVMVWTDNGRQQLTSDLYHGATQGLKSHARVSLFDVCTSTAKERRRRAALQRTNQWREEMLQQSSGQSTENSSRLWAACLLAASGEREDPELEQQFKSIQKALADKSAETVAFVGPCVESDPLQKVIQRLELNSTTSLAVLSTTSLTHFLHCYQVGVHILGTNLPAVWAKSNKAFVCDIQHWNDNRPTKRTKLEVEDLDTDGCYTVNKKWIRDERPILPDCCCLACCNHSRSYLCHLVLTKELLSKILLFIHNLHHLLALCRELSAARKEGKQDEIVKHIQKQIKQS